MLLLVPAHPGRPVQRAVKRLCVCIVVVGHVRLAVVDDRDVSIQSQSILSKKVADDRLFPFPGLLKPGFTVSYKSFTKMIHNEQPPVLNLP